MSRPTRVRVAFELTREEAEALRLYALSGITRPFVTGEARDRLDAALARGLARYDARTKGEVGDG